MFGDPIINEHNWPMVRVADFIYGFESGKSLASPADDGGQSHYRILKISSVTSGTFDPHESKPAPPAYNPPSNHIVRDGDLLFSRANTAELIGATALAFNPPQNLLLPDKLWRFVWKDPGTADPVFTHHLFRQKRFRETVSRKASGSSGSMKNISQRAVLEIECGLAPYEKQKIFADRIASIEMIRQQHSDHLAELDDLFASLQQRAFRGEL